MFRFVIYILEYLIVRLVRFVLLVFLFNFVMHCIISTAVVTFEIKLSYYLILLRVLHFNCTLRCRSINYYYYYYY